ncbi:SDR family NAD(P)-dependent oxidoreductase [Nonomuraea insulae]|uniref:SDR family NAD(P)-dependent oxidoreductase n=1 Tax=Nonomuraea insulae TaxID=1616787 RepID=A0ABW1CH83_9ACTN
MGTFDGKVAVVTGGASGIGAATAARLAARGARVVSADRSAPDPAAVTPAGITPWICDVTDPEAVRELVTEVVERFGGIDVLVANAGIWRQRPFLELTVEEWDEVLEVNLRGSFLVCQQAARAMADAGRGGAIVVTASTNSTVAEPDTAHYNASKGGLLMLVRSMAVDLAPFGIRVNAVAPGTIETPLNSAALATAGETFAFPPAGRWGTAEECAAAAVFLASDDAAYINGTSLTVDGGQTALNGNAPARNTP